MRSAKYLFFYLIYYSLLLFNFLVYFKLTRVFIMHALAIKTKLKVGNFQSIICEWGYNLLEGLRRYADDPEIQFFKLILEGQISEEVLHDMNATVISIFDDLHALDSSAPRGGISGTNTVKVAQFRQVLQNAFPGKGKRRLEALFETAKEPHPNGERKGEKKSIPWKQNSDFVQYDLLFKEDDQHEPGPFVYMMRTQYLQQRAEFLTEVERQLRNSVKKGFVTSGQCLSAIKNTDSGLPESEIKRLLEAGFRTAKDATHSHKHTHTTTPAAYTIPDSSEEIALKDFLVNMRKVVLQWYSPYTVRVKGVDIRL